jgi:hypothetical protein
VNTEFFIEIPRKTHFEYLGGGEMCVFMCVCIYISIYLYIYICIYISICMYIYIYKDD